MLYLYYFGLNKMNPNLEMQVNKTNVGLYTVTYGYKEAPLDVQEAAFAANGLEIVSPAQLGFLRAKEGTGTFKHYSRTNADVLYECRCGPQAIVVLNGAISKLVGTVNLVDAHRQGRGGREYVIPENQRDLIYAMVDEMLKSGIAFIVPKEDTLVGTSEFGKNDLTSRLFSDKSLGIEAQKYGNWLKSQGICANTFRTDDKDYFRSLVQKAPYLNRLCVKAPGGFVDYCGGDLSCDTGAFGVRFEKNAEGGAQK